MSNILEQVLTSVFSTNAFNQGGGWVDGFSGIAVTLNLTNADFHRVQSMTYSDDGEPVGPSDTVTAAGCQRPMDAADVLCSYSGFTNRQTFTNAATGQAWTPVDMFVAALSNSGAYAPRHSFSDVSGLPQWPQDVFVQPLRQSYTALPSPQSSVAPPVPSAAGALLNATGQPGRLYTLEVSSNLQAWTPAGMSWSLTGTNGFTDTQATNRSSGFYRLSTP